MTIAEPVKITQIIAEVLEQLEIPYCVVGSLASSFHGVPRATADVDLIADINQVHIGRLSHELKQEFYVDEDRIRKAVHARSSFNIIHLETMFKIDVFVLKDDPISKTEMERREKHQVSEGGGRELYLASAEDIILSKLQWYESGGCVSDRQWIDVLGVLKVSSDHLDFEYLLNTAEKRELTELVKKAINEADISKKG
jgi:hypothetical protein